MAYCSGVDGVPGNDVFCPRCRYNLRGLSTPRCPECGLGFDSGQWASGLLREHLPTWLDRCDPWQPHQVLVRSLYELLRGAVKPHWLLTKLDLNGPLLPAVLMLIGGMVWLYVLATGLIGVATFAHTGASPAASLKTGALYLAPRVLVIVLAFCAVLFGCASMPPFVRVERPTAAQLFRLAAYWIPSTGLYVLVPLTALLLCPDFVLGWSGSLPALMLCPWLAGSVPSLTGLRRGLRVRVPAWRLLVGLASPFAAGALADFLAERLLPSSLEPPWWVYAS